MKKKIRYALQATLSILICIFMCSCAAKQSVNMDNNSGYPNPVGTASSGNSADSDNSGYYQPQPTSGSEQNSEIIGEQYNEIIYNDFISTDTESTQAFSLKVDTASYTNISRYIMSGVLPPQNAVRTEELINYFSYNNSDRDMKFTDGCPFAVYSKTAASPFSDGKYMTFIRIKTPDIDKSELPPSNLTFLIDTSGSMYSYDKLPLLQQAFALLVENLTENDTVSIVTYAGSSSVVLDSVKGNDKDTILQAIYSLEAGGSTAGAQGIQTAYRLAEKNYSKNANNRVILATDGDFNVGISDTEALGALISEKCSSGVYLSVLGFGTGNIRDDIMETLSEKGNGNYSYIDTLMTAQKVLIDEMGANLFVAAKDVKAQLQFNKDTVKAFRLIGYENRQMSADEFDDYYKDAGEIGAGTDIAVLVELELKDESNAGQELMNVCIRYKTTDKEEQKELNTPVSGISDIQAEPDDDFTFACTVAGFAELLRQSKYTGSASADKLISMAEDSVGGDEKGYRKNFVQLLKKYSEITG